MVSRGWKATAAVVAIVLLILALVLALAEYALRQRPVIPGVQIVRVLGNFDQAGASWDPTVPYWEVSQDRTNRECVRLRPGAPRVLFLGDSIFYGHTLRAEEVFSHIVQRRLDDALSDASPCLANYAQSGFTGQQMLAQARTLIPAIEPDVLFWEVWWSAGHSYTVIGQRAYGLDSVAVGADGRPNPLRLPAFASRWLFERSRLFEYLSLSLARRVPMEPEAQWMPVVAQRVREVKALADAHGVRMVLVVTPALDRPFDDPSEATRKLEAIARRVAADVGVPALFLREALAGRDHLQVRLDPCCHFNAEGHRALADVFDAQVRKQLER